MRVLISSLMLLSVAAPAQFVYDDYPVADFVYPHNRLTVSPLLLVGGPDNAKMDEGIKVDLNFIPGVEVATLRYEHVRGAAGTFGFGGLARYYMGSDSLEYSGFSVGPFFRVYSRIGEGSFVQLGAEYAMFSGIQEGSDDDPGLSAGQEVSISGPQFTPILGHLWMIDRRWLLGAQMGFTAGFYTTSYGTVGEDVTEWGGYYFAELELGVAW